MTQTDLPAFTLGDRLTKARDWAGLTQAEMAAALGIGRRSIVRYENGKVPPRPAVIAWSAVTGVPMWWIDGLDAPELSVTHDKPTESDTVVTRWYPTAA